MKNMTILPDLTVLVYLFIWFNCPIVEDIVISKSIT
jgi:hypothetical protein